MIQDLTENGITWSLYGNLISDKYLGEVGGYVMFSFVEGTKTLRVHNKGGNVIERIDLQSYSFSYAKERAETLLKNILIPKTTDNGTD